MEMCRKINAFQSSSCAAILSFVASTSFGASAASYAAIQVAITIFRSILTGAGNPFSLRGGNLELLNGDGSGDGHLHRHRHWRRFVDEISDGDVKLRLVSVHVSEEHGTVLEDSSGSDRFVDADGPKGDLPHCSSEFSCSTENVKG